VLRNNKEALNQEEAAGLIEAIIRSQEPDNLHYVTKLLKAGKDPRRILDVMQIAAATVVMETTGPNNFSMPHHCYEYCNTLAWFFDNFDHPRRLRLIYLLASFLNHVAVAPEGDRRFAAGGDCQAEWRGPVDRWTVAGAGRTVRYAR